MSALLAPAEVRRKLATYGKPSRRQLHGLSPPRDSLSLSPRHRPALKPKDGQLRPSFVRKTIEVAIVVSPTKSARTGHNEAQGDGHPRAPSGALGEAKAKEHDPTLTISPQAQVETGPPAEEAPCVQWTEQAPKRAEEATALGRDHELSLFDFQSSDEDSWSWTADASPSKKPPLVIKKPSLLKASKTKLNQAEGRANGLALVLEQSRTNTKRKHGASHHAQPHSAASRTTTTLGLHMDNGSLGATNDHRASILCATTIPTSFVPELLGPDRKKVRSMSPSPAAPGSVGDSALRSSATLATARGRLIARPRPALPIADSDPTGLRVKGRSRAPSGISHSHTRSVDSNPRAVRELHSGQKTPTSLAPGALISSPSLPSSVDAKRRSRPSVGVRTPPRDLRQRSLAPPDVPRHKPSPHVASPQPKVWEQLSEWDVVVDSPSGLQLDRMRLSTHESDVERLGMENAVRTSVDSGGTDTTSGATRKRLIDSLLENEASEEDSSMIDSLEGDLAGEEGDAEDERHDSGPSQPDDPQVASQLFDSPLLTIDNPAPSRSLPASQEIPLRLLSDSQQSSQSVLRVQPTGPKLTYSQQRSYLSEASLMDELLLQQPLIAEGRTPGHARRRGAGGSGVSSLACSVPEEPDGADSSSASGIRNIHELRAAGRMKRYLDQFEGSLEDLDDRSVSGAFKRRSSLLELVTRLSTKPHSRRFLDLSLDRRLFHALAHEQDIVCGCMFAFLIVVLAREGLAVHACSHLCQQGAVQMLTRLLPSRADIVSIAPTMAPELAAGFAQVVAQSSIWTELPRCISPSLLALTTLEVMVNSGRDGGHASYPLSSDTIDVVLAVLAGIPALNGSPDLLSAGERLEVESGLSILEACSMSYAFLHASPRAEVFRTTLVKRWLLGITESCDARLKAIALLVLRLTLNITNIKSSRSGGILCSPDVVEALGRTISRGFGGSLARLQDVDEENEEEGFFSLDLLILALATMINLVESSSDIRDHFLDAGGEATALLDSLTHPFLRGLERTSEADCMEETHMNVALGYLSILLAHLCLHERLRPLICARMPRQTLEPIRRTALEFLHYHRQVDAQLAGGADYRGCRNDDAFTDRLQAVLERLEVVG